MTKTCCGLRVRHIGPPKNHKKMNKQKQTKKSKFDGFLERKKEVLGRGPEAGPEKDGFWERPGLRQEVFRVHETSRDTFWSFSVLAPIWTSFWSENGGPIPNYTHFGGPGAETGAQKGDFCWGLFLGPPEEL